MLCFCLTIGVKLRFPDNNNNFFYHKLTKIKGEMWDSPLHV